MKYCTNIRSRRPSGFRLSQVREETEDDIFAYNSNVELIESSSSVENADKKRQNNRKQSVEKKMMKILALLCSGASFIIENQIFWNWKILKGEQFFWIIKIWVDTFWKAHNWRCMCLKVGWKMVRMSCRFLSIWVRLRGILILSLASRWFIHRLDLELCRYDF